MGCIKSQGLFNMEEQLTTLLKNALNDVCKDDNTPILDHYYSFFAEKKIDEIFEDIEEGYNISLQSLKYGYGNDIDNMRKKYKQLIQAIINTFDTEKKTKLIPLIIFLDDTNLLYQHLIDINFFSTMDRLEKYCLATLNNIHLSLDSNQLPSHHWERESYEIYLEGIKETNFNKVYSFVEACERGDIFDYDEYIDFIVFISYKMNFGKLCEYFDNTLDPYKVIWLIHNLSIEETLNLAKNSNNIFLKFEAIRKAVYFQNNKICCLNLLKNERKLIQEILISFSKNKNIWEQFLSYYFEFPSRSVQLFEPLGQILNQIEKSKALCIVKKIQITKYFDKDSNEALNSCFLSIQDDELKKELLHDIFSRWDSYLSSYSDNLFNIMLTDVKDLVIIYLQDFVLENDIKAKIEDFVFEIREINNKWFQNYQSQINYSYILYTRLFVYSVALNGKYKEITDLILLLMQKDITLKHEIEDNLNKTKTTYQLFQDDVFSCN